MRSVSVESVEPGAGGYTKDCRIDPLSTGQIGVLDAKNYGRLLDRSQVFRTVGYSRGGEMWWAQQK